MSALWSWLMLPAHYLPLALCLYMLLEWALGKSKSVAANSLLSLFADALKSMVPGLSKALAALGSGLAEPPKAP